MCTEACGQVETPDPEELLEAFEIVAHDALGFLGPVHHLHPQPAATFNLEDGEPVPVSPAMARFPFQAVIDYVGGQHPVRLHYGDREYQLRIDISLRGAGYQPLQLWLDSLGMDHDLSNDAWINTPSSLARHTRRLAHALRDNFEQIIAAGPEVLQGQYRGNSAAELSRERDKARIAFADGDYQAVVDLLDPINGELTSTEKHQLDFASEKLRSQR